MSKHFPALALHPDESDPVTYLHAPMGAFLLLLHAGVHGAPGKDKQSPTAEGGRRAGPAPPWGWGRVLALPVTLGICTLCKHTQ